MKIESSAKLESSLEPAWYIPRGSGLLRDIIAILHPPYSAWFLSYVVIGAALAPELDWDLLGWTVLAFTCGMVIAAHLYDEYRGHPLKTQIPDMVLLSAGTIALGVAGGIGIWEMIELDRYFIAPLVTFGIFIVLAYNLEWFHGFFHTNFWFSFAWGAFPVITAYIAQTGTINAAVILLAIFALLYSLAQRALSTPVRFFRRKVTQLEGHYFTEGEYEVVPGTVSWAKPHQLTKQDIIQAPELALKLMTWAVVAIAIGLLLIHL